MPPRIVRPQPPDPGRVPSLANLRHDFLTEGLCFDLRHWCRSQLLAQGDVRILQAGSSVQTPAREDPVQKRYMCQCLSLNLFV